MEISGLTELSFSCLKRQNISDGVDCQMKTQQELEFEFRVQVPVGGAVVHFFFFFRVLLHSVISSCMRENGHDLSVAASFTVIDPRLFFIIFHLFGSTHLWYFFPP